MTAKKTANATAKKSKRKESTAPKKLSDLNAAAQVLAENGGSMTTKEMIEAMAAKKLWESPNGKTPSATLYSAILREIDTKGKDSRFKKTEPGKFSATGATGKMEKDTEEQPAPATKIAKPKATKPKAAKGAKGKGKKRAGSSANTTKTDEPNANPTEAVNEPIPA